MSPQQQRTAIAKACGWRFEKWNVVSPKGEIQSYMNGLGRDRERHNVKDAKEAIALGLIPDYCNDLNAMHEAEKALSEYDYREYRDRLTKDTFCQEHRATAAQRAEAFLRTIGKWEGGAA